MNIFYSAADIIVSRSGALALSEMAFLGKAMVLIPFPSSAGNHQAINAQTFAKKGGAVLVPQNSLQSGLLEKLLINLINNPAKIAIMEKKSKDMGIPNATNKIVKIIIDTARI